MALPMLISGADCGPVNPLQGLAKRFDQDRGLQQDKFGSGRAGPSRETFRTVQQTNSALEQEAARFFSGNGSQGIASPGPSLNAFDLSLLQKSLPQSHALNNPVQSSSQFQSSLQHQSFGSSWAADFLQQSRNASTASQLSKGKAEIRPQVERSAGVPLVSSLNPALTAQWTPQPMSMHVGPQIMPQTVTSPLTQSSSASVALWDKEFQSHEASLLTRSQSLPADQEVGSEESLAKNQHEADDLARTAGLLVDIVKDEQNPKFKNSQFLKLMRDLRDGDIVVDGNEMVERSQASAEAHIDVKGKGRAVDSGFQPSIIRAAEGTVYDPSTSSYHSVPMTYGRRKSVHFDQDDQHAQEEEGTQREEDPNEAYFRQENEEYTNYWNNQAHMPAEYDTGASAQQAEWGALQDSWDSFEASAWGVKPVAHYEFQPHNPYLRSEGTYVSRNHMMHSEGMGFHESVLELEAAVQRDPTNARAWFDLGVKQQENEREQNAIIALKRSLELDPTHLPSWLALAISHTNENDRAAADNAVEQWMRRNPKYRGLVDNFFERSAQLNGGTLDSLNATRRHTELVDCLVAVVRSGNGEVDADVQIALAVLLNTSEEYVKAQDCFKAALAVRPDDWQLYNRVGATLANSGSADEALQYYYRALELNPAYIRARFNLGISCINMKRYEEAAHHILDALVLQDSDGSVHGPNDQRGITSSTLWDSLKTTCLHLQRIDLATLCDRRDLDGFRREFHI